MRKYLPGKIAALEISLDSLIPGYPGAVLKITGVSMHSNSLKTSPTEYWGILRAECDDAKEMQAKKLLMEVISGVIASMSPRERQYVELRFDKEYPEGTVKTRMEAPERTYYRTKASVIQKARKRLANLRIDIDLALK